MRRIQMIAGAGVIAAAIACSNSPPSSAAAPSAASRGSLARVYYWRAKPGKLAEYTDYITKIAEPIDHEAQRRGAFISVTTFASRDTTTPWTHMRVFVLRDSAQLAGLRGTRCRRRRVGAGQRQAPATKSVRSDVARSAGERDVRDSPVGAFGLVR